MATPKVPLTVIVVIELFLLRCTESVVLLHGYGSVLELL